MELKFDTLCSASWTDVNIDLSRKQISHCCKSRPESYKKLKKNLINSSKGVVQRRIDTSKGIMHSQCDRCWKNYKKSNSAYRELKHQTNFKIPNNPQDAINYIEIKFDNVCNLACLYCNNEYSSTIGLQEGIKNPIQNYDPKDLDVLISFLNELLVQKSFLQINILGGEPTLSEGYHKLIQKLLKNYASKKIVFITTTNGIIHPNAIKKITKYVNTKNNWQWVWGFSGEATDKLFENIRHGADFDIWKTNVKYFSKLNNSAIVFDPTPSLLSIGYLYDYLKVIDSLCDRYIIKGGWIDSDPKELSVAKASKKHSEMLHECKKFLQKNNCLNKKEALSWINQLLNMLGTEKNDIKKLNNFLSLKNYQKENTLDVDYIINTL